eukprot:g7704.t1
MMRFELRLKGTKWISVPRPFCIQREFLGRRLSPLPPHRVHHHSTAFKTKRLISTAEMAGQYGENFDDISKHLTDLFTYKAVKTVLEQLNETDPTNYKFLYNFCVDNKPSQSYSFCKLLIKEKRELGERVLTVRVNLLEEWFKRLEKIDLVSYVNEKNLAIYRETLKESVNLISTAKPRPEFGE